MTLAKHDMMPSPKTTIRTIFSLRGRCTDMRVLIGSAMMTRSVKAFKAVRTMGI